MGVKDPSLLHPLEPPLTAQEPQLQHGGPGRELSFGGGSKCFFQMVDINGVNISPKQKVV